MHVMPARMHQPRIGAGIGQPRLLRDRQRVHIGANDKGRTRRTTLDRANHASLPDAGAMRDAEPLELGRDNAGRAHLVERKLGMLMQIAPDRHNPRFGLSSQGGNLGSGVVGAFGSGVVSRLHSREFPCRVVQAQA